MTITIYPPLAFNELGQRDNNEDSVSPTVGTASPVNRVFVVCDGVGGGVKGEVASRIVADGMVDYLTKVTGPSTDETVAAALRLVEQALDTYVLTDSEATGMATTLTLLHLHEQGATVAHVGDSRVYCCREGRVAFQTNDHKLVNEWVASGILTPEQAEDHPQRNVITRAVRGSTKPAQADVALLTGLRADDYFFLCTDGVLETLKTDRLCAILATNQPDEEKLALIRQGCEGKTSDNYSAYFVHIQSVVDSEEGDLPTTKPSETNQPVAQPTAPVYVADVTPPPAQKPKPVGAVTEPVPQLAALQPDSVRSITASFLGQLSIDRRAPYLLSGLLVMGLIAWYFLGHRRHLVSPQSLWSNFSAPAQSQVGIPTQGHPHQPNRPHKR